MSEGIVGQYVVPGRNGSGKRLLETSAQHELVVIISLFKKKYVCKYTWMRTVQVRVSDSVLMDYVSLPKRIRGRLLDVIVCRGVGGGMSDQILVELDRKWRVNRGC